MKTENLNKLLIVKIDMNLNLKKYYVMLLLMVLCLSESTIAADGCDVPKNAELIDAQENLRFVLVGELHGTVETPAIFSELVCSAVTSGKKILVGLEFPVNMQPIFKEFLASEGTAEDESRFLKESNWVLDALQFPDGRTSEAMWGMLKRLRSMRDAGYDLSVTTFMRPLLAGQDSQTPYEKGMAASLLEAAASDDYDLVMVLVGNIHALKEKGRIPFEPMAMHLPEESTLSLKIVFSGGTAWNCRAECGVGILPTSLNESPRQVSLGKVLSPGFDGIISVGEVTSSPPVTDGIIY